MEIKSIVKIKRNKACPLESIEIEKGPKIKRI